MYINNYHNYHISYLYKKKNKRGISSFHFLSIPYFIELSHALHEFLISCFDEKSCAQIVFCIFFCIW